jgi:hypothetical protein
MKLFGLYLLFVFNFAKTPLDEIRSSFQTASQNKENAVAFNAFVQQQSSQTNALYLAYLGASEAILAQFGHSVSEKLSVFKSGIAKIEDAVLKNPKSCEIHLIRLVIQKQSPTFLKYSAAQETDKQFILKHYTQESTAIKQYIRKVVADLKLFTSEEQTKLN